MAVPVSLRSVTKRFGDTVAVNAVDLEIREGELFFLLGPSGCGKSTALRLVAGFYHPEEGEIYFGERRMHHVPPHERNTGMVFQNYALWPHMTVYGNVEYGLNVRKVPAEERKKRVRQALEIVQMERYADRTPNQLSGGQQQRIALARALVIEPDVLLLDEPLSNLDAQLRDEMRQELKRIHATSGTTAFYVTHDQREALSLADRLAVMRDGRIVQVGTPREVYTAPANTFVASFIGATNFLEGRVAARSGDGLLVEVSIGPVRTRQIGDFREGEPVSLSIRPESLAIATEPTGNANEFEASVVGTTYLGSIEEYELHLDGSIPIRALMHNPGRIEYHPGQRVYISFAPADAIPLRRPADDPLDMHG